MRLVHFADLHLGYRQYQRLTPTGINQREADVARTFEHAIDRIIELAPEVVVIAGDVFHSVRPSNPAILQAFVHFSRLRQALPQTVTVMIAGNHDIPRSSETGSILQLYSDLSTIGIEVADREPRRISIPQFDLSILAVPDTVGQRPKFDPDPSFTYNVLLMHAEIAGVLPMTGASPERASLIVPVADLEASKWSYIALGHYHVTRQVDVNAWYSGSTDYTSTNTWGELNEERVAGYNGKGFIEWHFETATMQRRDLRHSRDFVDLPPISAEGLTVLDIDEQIRQYIERFPGGIDDRVVRLRLHDMPRHVARELDQRAIREYKRRALNFHLDVRPPDITRRAASGAPGRRATLKETLQERLAGRLLPGDVDRVKLIDLGLRYLDEAESLSAAVVPAES